MLALACATADAASIDGLSTERNAGRYSVSLRAQAVQTSVNIEALASAPLRPRNGKASAAHVAPAR
jgi:hypothetical protein